MKKGAVVFTLLIGLLIGSLTGNLFQNEAESKSYTQIQQEARVSNDATGIKVKLIRNGLGTVYCFAVYKESVAYIKEVDSTLDCITRGYQSE